MALGAPRAAGAGGRPAAAARGGRGGGASASAENVTRQEGHADAVASTAAPHTGHSNCSTISSANSAPQDGQNLASSSTAAPHTGHSNFTGSAAAADAAGSARMSSPPTEPFFATLLIVSKMSPLSSFPSAMEARMSSMSAFVGTLTWAVSRSSSASMSKRLRSVWQELQRFASHSILESQTGQTLVSPRAVWRHPSTARG